MNLDIEFVRQQFPQASDKDDLVFCSNAGGSYVALPVLELFEHYNRHTRVQPYSAFDPSREAGVAMDRARQNWAEALNIAADELTIGPSTSINSYVMAQAIGSQWGPGDEIILTQQDHEANHGVWRRMAEQKGASVKEWCIEKDSGLLDPETLYAQLSEKTRWVFFTHCSNIIGTVNPVKEIVAGIRSRSDASVGVDAVAYAPHHIADLKDLDVDIYLFSLYKVYGPHQGILYVRSGITESLAPQSHEFLRNDKSKWFNPAGPQHAEVAASAGVIDYLSSLVAHHDLKPSGNLCRDFQALHGPISGHESSLAAPILDYLHQSSKVRLLGKTHCQDEDRAATIAFNPLQQSSAEVATSMQSLGIGTENGNFYAHRVLENLGIDTTDGVVRISLVHYNTREEVQKILAALDQTLM